MKAMINYNKKTTDEQLRDRQNFGVEEIKQLKKIANTGWPEMLSKVENLAQEVFEEVVEHEMALAGLEHANLANALPEGVASKQQQSLIKRMSSLQLSLKKKQRSGVIPRYEVSEVDNISEVSSRSHSCSNSEEERRALAEKKKQNASLEV